MKAHCSANESSTNMRVMETRVDVPDRFIGICPELNNVRIRSRTFGPVQAVISSGEQLSGVAVFEPVVPHRCSD